MSQKKGVYKKLNEIVEQLKSLERRDMFHEQIDWTLIDVAQDDDGFVAWLSAHRVRDDMVSELRTKLNNRRLRLTSWETGNTPIAKPITLFIRFQEYQAPRKKETWTEKKIRQIKEVKEKLKLIAQKNTET